MESKNLSKKLLARLPVYLNYLRSLPESVENISATRIAKALNLGDVLVRKDLAKVSDGGRRKLGYLRENLIQDIEEFLDINSTVNAVVVGIGRLGGALLNYQGFDESGMNILAGFDVCPENKTEDGMKKPIYPMDELEEICRENDIRIGIITVPAEEAQRVCDKLVAGGVDAIWNYAPVHLNVPGNIVIRSENLAASLTTLRMQMKNKEEETP